MVQRPDAPATPPTGEQQGRGQRERQTAEVQQHQQHPGYEAEGGAERHRVLGLLGVLAR